jgi:hypothetical protein
MIIQSQPVTEDTLVIQKHPGETMTSERDEPGSEPFAYLVDQWRTE